MSLDLPISDAIHARPVYARYCHRRGGGSWYPPTEAEMADAILVLQEFYPPVWEIDELLLAEAERIHAEASIYTDL